ncbi:MAG: hypothetical protein JRM89_04335 [Nitrososphaerota archaeon]|nr:hypothetical protein [Nitrososphaerota archaeon]MDG6961521.1 hypothetical protein [Nitrososphaerota archaeon]MDG6981667.1 hypothetical protein [Nitrososphaerota archaeon]MDG7015203.1 hypothetical protein [Nitrososphaerota archaeon]WGO49963.1 MAG: hypothetical protein JRM93_03745 [Nitrososphaerota archaeon]
MEGDPHGEEGGRASVSNSFLFKGPTVVAALVCGVAAVFSVAIGVAMATSPGSLEGTLLVNLSAGTSPSNGLLGGFGTVNVALGVVYVLSATLLWSETHWVKGVYVGMIVSIVGMVWSGLATTFAPGIAAAGMIVNVLIATLLATETWEARRGTK